MASAAAPDIVRDRAIRLLCYLREFIALRWSVVRDCSAYQEVLWMSEVPQVPGWRCAAWPTVDDHAEWLKITKKPEPTVPELPALCIGWVQSAALSDDNHEPSLDQTRRSPGEVTGEMLVDHPEVQNAWLDYLIGHWQPWAERHRAWSSAQAVYDRVHAIYRQIQRLGEQFELRLGLGLLTWETPGGQRIRRHLLVARSALQFDAERAQFTLGLADEGGAGLSLELDMLEPAEAPGTPEREIIESQIEATRDDPWNRGLVDAILKQCAHGIGDGRGIYSDAAQPPTMVFARPVVAWAPALLFRRRTEKSILSLLDDARKRLESGAGIPPGFARLCALDPGAHVSPDQTDPPAPTPVDDTRIFFPLATNREQEEIVTALQSKREVLVQGPPGTGKTWTIANLICHLLATGKRVLVTSQTPRALSVLKQKLPLAIQPLCVSILGEDVHAKKDLEDTVATITNNFDRWQQGIEANAIQRLDAELNEWRKKRIAAENSLRQLREAETWRNTIIGGRYQGTTAEIARRLADERLIFAWLPDQPALETDLPLQPAECLRLLALLRRFGADQQRELSQAFCTLDDLPVREQFQTLIRAEKDAQARLETLTTTPLPACLEYLKAASPQQRARLAELTSKLASLISPLGSSPEPWGSRATTDLFAGSFALWESLHASTESLLELLIPDALWADSRVVSLNAADASAAAGALSEHLQSGGRLGWGPFRKGVVRKCLPMVAKVTVDGFPCRTPTRINELYRYLLAHQRCSHLCNAWAQFAAFPNAQVGAVVRLARQRVHWLQRLGEAIPTLVDLRAAVQRLPQCPVLSLDASAVAALQRGLEIVHAAEQVESSQAAIGSIVQHLQALASRPGEHPLTRAALDAAMARDCDALDVIRVKLQRLEVARVEWRAGQRLLARLQEVAPVLAAELSASPGLELWDGRLRDLEAAWNWRRALSWLRDVAASAPDEAAADIEDADAQILRLTGDLAAKLAWQACFQPDRLNDEKLQYLHAWAQEIRQIGRGTGRHAQRHRQNAQNFMAQCRDAVPAWIMPFYRVAESVTAAPEQFDVAIVDEASQSGPEMLILYYLAKRVVVVGDDQQISPEFVGTEQQQVHTLLRQFLPDFELRETFGIGHSLFDHAAIRSRGRIVLREHFRCMPEIIRFSNELCYRAHPLWPLRQFGTERLTPIQTAHVPTGYREGNGQRVVNRPEAEALVDQIVRCCADPSYALSDDPNRSGRPKSFGVISLQGQAQADLIDRLLRQRLGAEELEAHSLVCGDAYAFQGAERDVMFLSLVAAPNQDFRALTEESAKRRFNVAASRARDQVWLFHSVTLNDLNPDDLRSRLLGYYLDPSPQSPPEPDWTLCGSEFERRVGRLVHARGYRLYPQYAPFGPDRYRIDFMVESGSRRLAVECDGDRWHGAEQYEHDMYRQRQLERAGWRFWRVRESDFNWDSDAAMGSLWEALDDPIPQAVDVELGEPGASGPSAPAATFQSHPGPTVPIDALSVAQIREAIQEGLRIEAPLDRDGLLRAVANGLGYSRVGARIRSRLTRILAIEVRAGRVRVDGADYRLPTGSL